LVGALVMIFVFISITAMPPSGLFVSEFLIFRSLFESHQIFILLFVLLFLTLIFWALGKNILKMLFVPPIDINDNPVKPISPWESISQFILLSVAVYLGLNPPTEFVQLINESIMLLPK
jgi:hydrogenase-4 component F